MRLDIPEYHSSFSGHGMLSPSGSEPKAQWLITCGGDVDLLSAAATHDHMTTTRIETKCNVTFEHILKQHSAQNLHKRFASMQASSKRHGMI